MRRADVVSEVAAVSGQSRQVVDAVLDGFTQVLADALRRGEKVTIPGLLSAEAVARAERAGRNPRTGEPLVIAARTGVNLKAGTGLRDAVAS